MVLDTGRVAEFDTPIALLQREGGMLKALVDDGGDNLFSIPWRKETRRRLLHTTR
ncbi:hypothetical protein BDZ97DRAFT_1851396, partial [Flammula alnicola]